MYELNCRQFTFTTLCLCLVIVSCVARCGYNVRRRDPNVCCFLLPAACSMRFCFRTGFLWRDSPTLFYEVVLLLVPHVVQYNKQILVVIAKSALLNDWWKSTNTASLLGERMHTGRWCVLRLVVHVMLSKRDNTGCCLHAVWKTNPL